MDRQRWKEIEAIYQAAVDKAEEQRQAYLDQVCADDAELRSEVEALLAVHESRPGSPRPRASGTILQES